MFVWLKTKWFKGVQKYIRIILSWYYIEIKPNNKDQKKELEKRKAGLAAASELYEKLLNTYNSIWQN